MSTLPEAPLLAAPAPRPMAMHQLASYEDLSLHMYSSGAEWPSVVHRTHLLPDGDPVFLLAIPGEHCTSIGINAVPILDPNECESAAAVLGAEYDAPMRRTSTAAAAEGLQAGDAPPIGCFMDATWAPMNHLVLHTPAAGPGPEGGDVDGRCSFDMICLCKMNVPSPSPLPLLTPSPPTLEAPLKLFS
jgi:hypothetical protein